MSFVEEFIKSFSSDDVQKLVVRLEKIFQMKDNPNRNIIAEALVAALNIADMPNLDCIHPF